jgi:hypothetical protein
MPGRVIDNTEKTGTDVEIAHAFSPAGRIRFEFFSDLGNSCGTTDWGAGNNTDVVTRYISYLLRPLAR